MIKTRKTHGFIELKCTELEEILFQGENLKIQDQINEFKDIISDLEEYLEEDDTQ